jgi:hypothetical protein
MTNVYKTVLGYQKKKKRKEKTYHFQDLSINGRIILKCIFKEDRYVCVDWIHVAKESLVVGSFKYVNELSSSINMRGLLSKLMTLLLVSQVHLCCCPWQQIVIMSIFS